MVPGAPVYPSRVHYTFRKGHFFCVPQGELPDQAKDRVFVLIVKESTLRNMKKAQRIVGTKMRTLPITIVIESSAAMLGAAQPVYLFFCPRLWSSLPGGASGR